MEQGLINKKCDFEPNIKGDWGQSCLRGTRRENEWASRWIGAHNAGHLTASIERLLEVEVPA